MARGKLKLSIGPDKPTKRILQMVREWPKRTKAMMSEFTYDAAEDTRKQILQRLPTGKEYKDYRDQLQVAEIQGLSSGETGHVLHVPIKSSKVTKSDARSTLLYVTAKKANKTVSAKIGVLEKFGPWPIDLLPFKPAIKDAKTISRRVSQKEVDQIRKGLEKKRSKWMSALTAAGAADKKSERKIKSAKRLQAVPDVAFTALRLEFGMGGTRAKAHCRPALSELIRNTIPKATKKVGKFDKAMTDPKNTDWMSWPSHSKGRIRVPELKSFSEFQDKLGIKVT